MPDLGTLVPLIVFFGLGVAVVVLVWRALVVGGALRAEDERRRAAAEIARATSASLGELASAIDEVRRRKVGPERATEPLARAAQDVFRRRAEAEALVRGGGLEGLADELTELIGRAERSIELIAHGLDMLTVDAGARKGEGETDVKRGYLSLLHCQQELTAKGDEIAAPEAGGDWNGSH